MSRAVLSILVGAILVAGCGGDPPPSPPEPPPFDPGTAVVACGERFEIGTPVVLWSDPIGFDAYATRCFSVERELPIEAEPGAKPERYGRRDPGGLGPADARRVREQGWDLDLLRRQVRLFVIHYDAVGTSTRCFRALHDRRGLSVHFMLDLDGTVYQTLDLRERAFHAGDANDASIGVEIAQVGAMSTPKLLEEWYERDADGGVRITPPERHRPGRQRLRGFDLRPARDDLVSGTVQGSRFVQYDYTEAQYAALARLAAGLARIFPRIRLEAPRDSKGRIPTSVLPDARRLAFEGILGHWHVSAKKYDPGPAFDWDRFLRDARAVR